MRPDHPDFNGLLAQLRAWLSSSGWFAGHAIEQELQEKILRHVLNQLRYDENRNKSKRNSDAKYYNRAVQFHDFLCKQLHDFEEKNAWTDEWTDTDKADISKLLKDSTGRSLGVTVVDDEEATSLLLLSEEEKDMVLENRRTVVRVGFIIYPAWLSDRAVQLLRKFRQDAEARCERPYLKTLAILHDARNRYPDAVWGKPLEKITGELAWAIKQL